MKNNLRIATALLLTVSTSSLFAASARNYWFGGGRPSDWYADQDWMGKLRNDVNISQISIPGTHASGSFLNGGNFTLTQSMNFSDQLIAGIRMWDLRVGPGATGTPCANPLILYIYDGPVCQNTRLSDALQTAIAFLFYHPTETILIRLKQEDISPLMSASPFSFEVLLNIVLGGRTDLGATPPLVPISNYLYKGTDLNPTLGSLRQKIFIFKDFPADISPSLASTRQWCDSPSGSCSDPLSIQDTYRLSSNESLAFKWLQIQSQLDLARLGIDTGRFFVNFTSATTKGISDTGPPFFFASGQGRPQNGEGLLWTGYTRTNCPSSICLPEFPSGNTLGLVFYTGINDLLSRKIALDPVTQRRAGLILMDFPGGGLIGDIIKTNDDLRITRSPVANPDPQSDSSIWYNRPILLSWNWTGETTLVNCPVSTVISSEGTNTASSTCRDIAQRQSSAEALINIDYTPPTGTIRLARPTITGTATSRPIIQTVAGSFADSLSRIDPNSGSYLIEDSYGGQLRGPVNLLTSGLNQLESNFFFQVTLNSMIRPNEPRTFRIFVFAKDRAGNDVAVSATTLVR